MSKIMLVDDNEVIIDLYERTINDIPSAEVVAVAKNGEEAIEMLENNVENIDLIILDIVMPKKDGNIAIKEIMEFDKDAVIIIVSSVGTQSQLKCALESGATDFIQKPINKIQIIDAVNKYLGR